MTSADEANLNDKRQVGHHERTPVPRKITPNGTAQIVARAYKERILQTDLIHIIKERKRGREKGTSKGEAY